MNLATVSKIRIVKPFSVRIKNINTAEIRCTTLLWRFTVAVLQELET